MRKNELLYLERQVRRLKRERDAAKDDARINKRLRLKAQNDLAGTRNDLNEARYLLYAEREQNAVLANRVAQLETTWNAVGETLWSWMHMRPLQLWHTLTEPLLNWYAVKRISKERYAAIVDAGYADDISDLHGIARRYWQWDRDERKSMAKPVNDAVTVYIYRNGLLEEISNEIASFFLRFKKRASLVLRKIQNDVRAAARRSHCFGATSEERPRGRCQPDNFDWRAADAAAVASQDHDERESGCSGKPQAGGHCAPVLPESF